MADGGSKLYDVWWQNLSEGEQQMEERHRQGWLEIIQLVQEEDLRGMSVLDFGCNQGGFLRYLYERKPFKEGFGTDLAQKSIVLANERKGELPLSYVATDSPEQFPHRFDLAFSLSVIYLIEDLPTHARKIRQALKPGGVYYTTFTDYTGNPSADHFRQQIQANSLLKANMHTLDDIASAFVNEGFQAEIRRRQPTGFISVTAKDKFMLSIRDKMQAQYEQAYLFRFVARV
ncbi:bifunctional 2-polyprenyl-6-hydroxyphenol methylase/3-demethylubiquinol 3-O-methyltransferase UbiG [Paenibacillus sp. YN15]|uniref:class I SAM-dependent methyltransferase n=1 Tax=Paenibacillus sp. YN15 TaxID=1742774 RepID=UPI000DCE9216|nr:methyltransferase domain-containing protein [Paenibacillus sp. YN15]RAV01264.1 SAM-dependent methyltransferase [Paenibacillus sp. YN15]